MPAPTFKKATDQNAGDSTRYGAPDIKYAFDVLDGTHSTDRIQASVIEHNVKDYDVIVYNSGGTTYARRGADSTLVSSSASAPEQVIQAAIDEVETGGGKIYIAGGIYDLSNTFTGIKIDYSFITVTMAPDCVIRVPSGFGDAVFKLNTTRHATQGYISGAPSTLLTYADTGFQRVTVEGGMLADQAASSSQARNWTGVRIYASYAGSFLNTVRDMWIGHCYTGIELLMDDASPDTGNLRNEQWANSNLFENIWIWDAVVGVDFNVHANVTPATNFGFNFNTFRHVVVQAGDGVSPRTDPEYGFKNIRHENNQFVNCMTYDFAGAEITAKIHSSAVMTTIIGGAIARNQFDDDGDGTMILDPWYSFVAPYYTNVEAYGFNPSSYYVTAQGTKASPTANTAGNVLAEFVNCIGHNGTQYKTTASFQVIAAQNWTGSNHDSYLDLQFADSNNGAALPTSKFKFYGWGDFTIPSGGSIWVDGGNNTRMYEQPGDTWNFLTNNDIKLKLWPTYAMLKGFSGASDPTTTELPDRFFTVAKNTGSGATKVFYNDGGSLKTWATADTADTLTNKTIAFGSNTLTDVASLNTAQTFTTAAKTFNNTLFKLRDSDDTHSYVFNTSNISTADKNVTLPALTADDTFVFANHTQTLAGKTLTSPTVNDPSITKSSQAITLPTGPATLNTIDTAQTISGVKTYQNQKLAIRNPADTFSYIVNSGAITTADKSVTLPALTGNDTFVFEAHPQTLTNKTVNATGTPSITSTGAVALAATQKLYLDGTAATGNTYLHEASADVFQVVSGGNVAHESRSTHALNKAYVNASDPTATEIPDGHFTVARNTGSGAIKVFYNNGGSVAPISAGSWDPNAIETLTNKTIAFASNTLTNVASLNTAQTFVTAAKTFNNTLFKLRDSDDSHSYVFNTSNISTADKNVTLPALTADDTFAFQAHPQTLTNKTIDYSSNPLRGVMPNGEGKAIGGWMGGKSLALWGIFVADAAANAITVDGTEGSTTMAALTKSLGMTTGNVSGNQAGWRTNNGHNQMSAQLRPRFKMKFKFITSIASIMFYAGFHGTTGALVAGDNKLNASLHGFALWLNTVADNTLRIAHNDGDTSTDYDIITGSPTADTTTFHTIELGVNTSDQWYYSYDGAAPTTILTEVPSATAPLYPYITLETRSANARTFDTIYWFYEYTNGG